MLASLASLNDILKFFMFFSYFFRFLFEIFEYIFLFVLFIFMLLTALLLDPEENIEMFIDLLNEVSRTPLVHEDVEKCDKNQSQLNIAENVKEPYKNSTQLNMDDNVDNSSTTSDHINTDENVGEPLSNSSHISSTPSSPRSSNSSYPTTDEDLVVSPSSPHLSSLECAFFFEHYIGNIDISDLESDYYNSDADSENIVLDSHCSIASAQSSPPAEQIEAEVEQGMNQGENNANNVSDSNILSSDSNVNNVVGNPESILEENTTASSVIRNQSA